MAEMGRKTKIARAGSRRGWGVSLLVLAGLCGGLIIAPISAHAGKFLTRLSAESTAINTTGLQKAIKMPSGVRPSDAGVIQICSNSGTTPANDNIMYVTISGEALGRCDGIALLCQVDGKNCVPGNATPGFPNTSGIVPNGWVVPQGQEFNEADENDRFGLTGVNFQWCTKIAKIKGNKHTIKIFGATERGDCNTYLEGVYVYIDTNSIPKGAGINACGSYPNPNPVDSPD
jgi:hypothetical protein